MKTVNCPVSGRSGHRVLYLYLLFQASEMQCPEPILVKIVTVGAFMCEPAPARADHLLLHLGRTGGEEGWRISYHKAYVLQASRLDARLGWGRGALGWGRGALHSIAL